MEGIANRFVQLQGLQESLLKQIREFKESGDPNKLPDIVEANKLDDELQDLARELDAPSDTSPSNARRRRSQVYQQFSFASPPIDLPIPPIPLSTIQSSTSSRATSVRESSLSSRTISVKESSSSSSRRSSLSKISLSLPSSRSETPIVSAGTPAQVTPELVVIPTAPLEPVSWDLLSPNARQRRRQNDSFQLPPDVPPTTDFPTPVSSNVTSSSQPAPVVLPTFSEIMKSYPHQPSEESSEISLSEISNVVEQQQQLEEAPVVTKSPRRSTTSLNYQITERTLYEPPAVAVAESSETPPPVMELPKPVELPTPIERSKIPTSPLVTTPSRTMSPLRDSNRRRSAMARPETTSSKFWDSVHQQRIKTEKIFSLVSTISSVLESHKNESRNIRVNKFGILGEYLFQQQRELVARLEQHGFPNKEASENSSGGVAPAPTHPSMFDTVKAVLLIQRYFRRFVKRRRDRIEAVKNLANAEANDAREKLRKRRLERKTNHQEEQLISREHN